MPSTYAVGIDLGTTHSAAAYLDQQGCTQMIPNAEGVLLTPSVALFEGNKVIVGRDAKRAQASAIDHVAETAKRDMGRKHYRHSIHGQRLPPEAIQGYILRKLSADITAALGTAYEVVITVPAYFDEPRRKSTADAGQMSGLAVLDIVNEPTAAALAFGERLGYLDRTGAPRDTLTLLVYDLGGGTFDVTVIRLEPGKFTTLATDGDVELGGYNWDMRLVDFVLERFCERFPEAPTPDEASRRRLRHEVEEAKHTLSVQQKATIRFQLDGNSIEVPVSRSEFEGLTAELLERTAFTTRQTLGAAGLTWNDIDRLLLVGGSTRMPMVRRMLQDISGMAPDVNVNPDEAVARGAAIYAQHILAERGIRGVSSDLKITDVNAHSLGIEGVIEDTLRRENVVLIPRNTPLPCEVHRTFRTKVSSQQSVKIQLLEGESTLPEHCTPLAKAAIRNLPPGLPEGTEVDVCYRFAANGCFSVDARLPGRGKEAKIELERVQGLSDNRVQRWKQLICRDGGFDDFGDAVMGLLEGEETPSETSEEFDTEKAHDVKDTSLEPAVPYGAPAAASETLKNQRQRSSRKRRLVSGSRRRLFIAVSGHIVASVLGLMVGYYILCLIQPQANFLNLELPGLEAPVEPESPADIE